MKNTIFSIALMLVSTIALGQRKIPMATRYCPAMENQVTKEDLLKDEFALEYTEREFQGAEEDTASLNANFRKMEALQEGKITTIDKEDGPNLEEMYWMDSKDMEKEEAIEKEKENAVKPK